MTDQQHLMDQAREAWQATPRASKRSNLAPQE